MTWFWHYKSSTERKVIVNLARRAGGEQVIVSLVRRELSAKCRQLRAKSRQQTADSRQQRADCRDAAKQRAVIKPSVSV
jgi:hypothetical protein